MKLKIVRDKNYCYSKRWIVSRRCSHAERSQHAHFRTKQDARIFIDMIYWQICPRTEEYQEAMERVCTRKELEDLNRSNARYKTFINYLKDKYIKGHKNKRPKYYRPYFNGNC